MLVFEDFPSFSVDLELGGLSIEEVVQTLVVEPAIAVGGWGITGRGNVFVFCRDVILVLVVVFVIAVVIIILFIVFVPSTASTTASTPVLATVSSRTFPSFTVAVSSFTLRRHRNDLVHTAGKFNFLTSQICEINNPGVSDRFEYLVENVLFAFLAALGRRDGR